MITKSPLRTSFYLLFLLTLFSIPNGVSGQAILGAETPSKYTQVEADSLSQLPFPLVGITRELGATERLLNQAAEKDLDVETREAYKADLDSLASRIYVFMEIPVFEDLGAVSYRELDQLRKQGQLYMDEIDEQKMRLSALASELESQLLQLQVIYQRWVLTLNQGADDPTLEARAERIRNSIAGLAEARKSLQEDMFVLLEYQDELNEKRTELNNMLARIQQQQAALDDALLKRDVPGILKDLEKLGEQQLLSFHWNQFKRSYRTDLLILRAEYMRGVTWSLIFLLILLIFTSWFKRNHSSWLAEDRFGLSEAHLVIVNSPVLSVLFFVPLMFRLLVPDLPRTFYALNLLLLMIPMAILMVRVYGRVFRYWVIVLVVLASLNMLYELSYHPGAALRLLLLGQCLAGIWLFAWISIKKPYGELIRHRLVYSSFRILLVIFLAMQVLAIIANLAGTFRLAELLARIPISITITAIAIQLASKVSAIILYLVLASNYLQKLHVVGEKFQLILQKLIWLVDFIFLLVFIRIALSILRIYDQVMEWGSGVLSDGMKIGAVSISLGSILIFIFVIWLSIMISRIISSIVEKDVFTRVKVGKGVPATVILMLKIVLISGGFFLAAAASGMKLTNLSIVLGAFSVGIGFGLQNIFNNMVSGIILAFERPIKVGDIVQVGELVGTVGSIGLRSSTVKSFDGAEVIVPNGNLISNEMINWTLSDSFRRMDLRVGVKYGTDPDRVLEIMEKIANEHEGVMKQPPPKAYFIEFGDSSLNFRLLAWAHLDVRLEVESEILVLINRKLAEAGIEIPFPQRDLHIKSDATRIPDPGSKKAED